MARTFRGMNTIRKSAEAATQTLTAERVILIEDGKIIDNPLNEGLNMGDIDALAESLKETNGPIEPAVVWDMGDGTYMLVSGHRRRHAWCRILGNPTLNCSIRPYPQDPLERFRTHAVANTQTREKDPLFWVNEIRHAREVLEETGFEGSEAEIKEEIHRLLGDGASPTQIARYEGFSKLEPELRAVSRFGLSASTLYSAVRLSPEQQRRLAARIEEHYASEGAEEISRDVFEHLAKAEKGSRKAEEDKPKLSHREAWTAKTTKISGNLMKRLRGVKTAEEKEAAREAIAKLKDEIRLVEELLSENG